MWEARIRKEELVGKKGKDPSGLSGGEKKERKGKEKERKGERGKSTSFFPRSLAFRRSELVEPRSKVRLLDRILPTLVISTLRAVWSCFLP